MALGDTQSSRMSALRFQRRYAGPAVYPDGTYDQGDRQAALKNYYGLNAPAPNANAAGVIRVRAWHIHVPSAFGSIHIPSATGEIEHG